MFACTFGGEFHLDARRQAALPAVQSKQGRKINRP